MERRKCVASGRLEVLFLEEEDVGHNGPVQVLKMRAHSQHMPHAMEHEGMGVSLKQGCCY